MPTKPKVAPRLTLQIQLDTEGKISAIYAVLNTRFVYTLLAARLGAIGD